MTDRERIQCAWEKCNIWFTPKTYNGKYHSLECQRAATNAKTLKQYHEKKAIRQGKKRICLTPGCDTILSRYNSLSYCQGCLSGEAAAKRNKLLGKINSVIQKET